MSSPDQQKYIPGVCNIGPAERARRRRSGYFGLVLTIVLLAILVAIGAPKPRRLLIFLPAFVAATGFLQSAFHFCAGFGLKGLYNVAMSAGDTTDVTAEKFRAKDRQKAFQIFALSLIAAIIVTAACFI